MRQRGRGFVPHDVIASVAERPRRGQANVCAASISAPCRRCAECAKFRATMKPAFNYVRSAGNGTRQERLSAPRASSSADEVQQCIELRHGSLHVGHQARPDAPIAPVGAIDRVTLPVRGRPPTPVRAIQHSAVMQRRQRVSLPTYITDQISGKDRIRSHWVAVIGGYPRGDGRRSNSWRITTGTPDAQSISTQPRDCNAHRDRSVIMHLGNVKSPCLLAKSCRRSASGDIFVCEMARL